MPDIIQVGNVSKGYTTNPLAFNIDNDAFPTLENAYQWRGRIKRKRGTSLLGRLERYFNSTSSSYTGTTVNPSYTITFDGSGNANLLGPYTNATPVTFSLQANGNIVPGSVTITGSVGPVTYTDPTKDGYLTPTGTGGANTINYGTGAIHIPAQAGGTATIQMLYYPDLPVMGLEDLRLASSQFPGTLGFDTVYSYNITTVTPYDIYDVSFYKNPASATFPGYTAKATPTRTTWNGQDYQQFWTTNYQGALWATNGINVPFSVTNIGMQFKVITTIDNITPGPPAFADLTITAHGLVVGDFVFINEVPIATVQGINYQTGYVTALVSANKVTVEFPSATLGGGGAIAAGIAQYLTNRSDPTKDVLRWYDGDPTTGDVNPPVLTGHLGWVNFMPPLSQAAYSISDLPALVYYLVGARIIIPFKDRLLFIGPVVQSSGGTPIYLQDTIIYSQNGTPYYTTSYTNSPAANKDTPTSSTNSYTSILVPANQTATPNAYFEDVTGFGGFIQAGIASPIISATPNEDVIIIGFSSRQVRLIYTGNDIVPFNLFTINSEFGSGSTFSAITLDRGALSLGNRGIIETSQVSSQRIDLPIPDTIFTFNLQNNGAERVTAQRDFINEWVYFSYSAEMWFYKFPSQTLQYNYRDGTWALFNECYTTYGQFIEASGYTWATIGRRFPTWSVWYEPWSSGSTTLMQPKVIAGNQQGFVLFRVQGTNEATSLFITSISGSTVTSPNHCLNSGDYIVISGVIGTLSSQINSKVFQVTSATTNTFFLNPQIGSGTYVGGGVITRLYIPKIQTKQFPVAWGMARKTRLGVQQYLFTGTPTGQITLQIYLSQNSDSPYNEGPIVPESNSINDALVYSDILFTCPESINIGLTEFNENLNLITASQQNQIWHRMNTSLIGDSVQIGFTLSEAQMTSITQTGKVLTLTGATQANPCVLTCRNSLSTGQLVRIDGVVGMTQLNFDDDTDDYYNVIARSGTTITIDVDATAFTAYVSGGTVTPVGPIIQTSEIELHGFTIAVYPSQILA